MQYENQRNSLYSLYTFYISKWAKYCSIRNNISGNASELTLKFIQIRTGALITIHFSKCISDVTINYNKFVWKFPFWKFYCIILFIYEFDFFFQNFISGKIYSFPPHKQWLCWKVTQTGRNVHVCQYSCSFLIFFLLSRFNFWTMFWLNPV